MKTIITSALVASALFAGAANAALSSDVERKVQNAFPAADLTSLTAAEAATVANIVHSTDSVSEVRAQLRAILN